ncbi:MAG: hypothetical protein ABIT16_08585 [Croceibacterium sp.]
MTDDPVKRAWQASVEIAGGPALDEVRKGADKLYRTVRRRNLVEYAACVFVVIAFGTYVFVLPHLLQKIGSGMIILATFYVGWQLHRRASAVLLDRAGTMPLLAFARQQLARQRDALSSIFWWYILPFLPGLVVMLIGNGLKAETVAGGPSVWVRWLAFAGMGAVLAGIWWLNQLAARKLQSRINEIDVLTGGV